MGAISHKTWGKTFSRDEWQMVMIHLLKHFTAFLDAARLFLCSLVVFLVGAADMVVLFFS